MGLSFKKMIYLDEYGFALYIFMILLGISITSYLIAFSEAITIISSIFDFTTMLYSDILRYVILLTPILIAIYMSYPKKKYGASILKYLAFVANMALMLSFFTVPFAGLSFMGGFEYLYLLILGIGFGNAYIVNYLISSMPWFIVRYLISGGGKTNTIIEKLGENDQLEIMKNNELEVHIYGREDRIENIVVSVEPSSIWTVYEDKKNTFKKYTLKPVEDGESILKIIYRGKPLHQIIIRSIGISKFAKLTLEFLIGGKAVKIIETYHLVGTPLRHTLKRIQKIMPKNFNLDNLSIQLKVGNRYLPIDVHYTNFEQGKEYHLIIQVKGETTPITAYVPSIHEMTRTTPKLITREWSAKPRQETKHKPKSLTREYVAKPVSSQEKTEKRIKKAIIKESTHKGDIKTLEDELTRFLEELSSIYNKLEQAGDDIW